MTITEITVFVENVESYSKEEGLLICKELTDHKEYIPLDFKEIIL